MMAFFPFFCSWIDVIHHHDQFVDVVIVVVVIVVVVFVIVVVVVVIAVSVYCRFYQCIDGCCQTNRLQVIKRVFVRMH